MNTAPVLLNNMTANNFQRALNNLTTVKKQGHVNVTEVITSNNTTAYRVTFYFNNPENTQMLRNNSLASNITSVKITRLQKGRSLQTDTVFSEGFQVVVRGRQRYTHWVGRPD